MVVCRYEISVLVLKSTSHSLAALESNTRREIPYLRAPMYDSLFLAHFEDSLLFACFVNISHATLTAQLKAEQWIVT